MRSLVAMMAALGLSLGAVSANAMVMTADTAIEFYDSGAGPMVGPYGGTWPGSFPVAVDLGMALDGNADTFVSLPTGSFMTFGFSSGVVFDGAGLDIFISEVGGSNETADVFVSSDLGVSFTLLGQATTATVSGFDLADIGYSDDVNAVKVVGLDNYGGSPGFDVAYVQGMEGSVKPVSLPATMALLGAGLLGMMVARRR